jgi:hypothetical protein
MIDVMVAVRIMIIAVVVLVVVAVVMASAVVVVMAASSTLIIIDTLQAWPLRIWVRFPAGRRESLPSQL